jgi:multiple sugar transport system substrate-binding protein
MRREKLSRRDFLHLAAGASAGTLLAACAPATPEVVEKVVTVKETVVQTVVVEATPVPEPTTAPPPIEGSTVTVMYPRGEFTEEYEQEVEGMYSIEMNHIEEDYNRLNAMWAAGNPPDIWRVNASKIGPFVLRDQVLAMNEYVDASDLVKWDDMYPPYLQHMFDGAEVGSGNLYGIVKDWSPDFSLFINTEHFEEAGLDLPPEDEPLTFAEIGELSRALTQREGDRTLRWGLGHGFWFSGIMPHLLLELLPQTDSGDELYSESLDRVNLTSPGALEITQFFYDLAKDFAIESAIDPSPNGYGPNDFPQGAVSIASIGFWFGQMAESDATSGKVQMIPAPKWNAGSERRNSMGWGTATCIASTTKVPDAAWKVVEYFSGGKPASDRAASGWGVPIQKSLFHLIPEETEFEKQKKRVLLSELEYTTHALRFNPFQGELFEESGPSWEAALRDEITLEEALAQIEAATNDKIKDNIERLI